MTYLPGIRRCGGRPSFFASPLRYWLYRLAAQRGRPGQIGRTHPPWLKHRGSSSCAGARRSQLQAPIWTGTARPEEPGVDGSARSSPPTLARFVTESNWTTFSVHTTRDIPFVGYLIAELP